MTLVLKPAEIYAKRLLAGSLGLLAFSDKWETRPLGELINLLNGAPFDSAYFNTYGLGKPLIRIRDVGKSNTETWYNKDYDDKFLIKAGDVLVGLDGDFKAAEWRGPEALLNQRVCKLEPKEDLLDKRFMLYHLQGWLDAIWEETSATTVKHLSSKSIQDIPFPVPSIEEQKRIVETLDLQFQKLERAKEETTYAALGAKRFSSSLLHAMFTGDLMQSELGIENSNLIELSSVAEVQSGSTPKGLDRLTSESPADTHTVPFYKVGDMNRDSRYMDSSRSYLNQEEVAKLRLKLIPEGSVVFPKAGGAIATDKKRLVRVPGAIDLNCMAVIPSSQLLPTYLAWWFESFKLSDLSNGSILPQIGKTSVMQVQVPCPSLAEQLSIVEYLELNISRIRVQASEIENLANSIETLRRSILNKAFTGQ